MRFDRQPQIEGYNWTARKEAMYLKRHEREAKRIERDIPLFADQFAPAPSLDVEDEKARRDRMARRSEQTMRNLDAKHWRKGRAAYFACAPEVRALIAEEWRNWRGPAKPGYFIYVVEKHNGEGAERSRRIAEREAQIRERINAQLTAQGRLPLP